MSIFDLANMPQSPSMGGTGGIGALDNNSIYPLSRMDKTQYSVPTQLPTSAEIISSDYDPKMDAFTGMPQRFEEGGDVVDPAPEEAKPPTMGELAEQIKYAYRTNQNYDDLWKQFQSMKSEDPQEWYRKELEFLGGQQGWQIGQNTEGRADALMPQLKNTVEEAKTAGLAEEEIQNILGTSSQEANMANQRRIAEEGAKGKGWVNQNIPGGWATVGTAAALAAAPYAYGALAGTTGAGGLTAASVPSLTTGLAVPTTGALAGTGIGAGTAAGASGLGLTAASVPSLATGLAVPTTGALGGIGTLGGATAGMTTGQKLVALKLATSAMGGGGGGSESAPSATMTTQQSAPPPSVASTQFNPAFSMPSMFAMNQTGPGAYYQPTLHRYAEGGVADLGGYAAGGKLLKGPGDGMSDDIVANIAGKQPARLADGEFVVPADVVSHLGNGSTDAGAKHLYKMMDRIRQARTGNPKQGKRINPDKFLPKG